MPLGRQLPLDFGHAPGLSRDDLVVSAANRAAVEMLERWPDWPSPVVILAGPAGSGKTHLASVWRDMAGALDVAGYAAGEQRFGAGQGLLVDDADSPPLDETGLFHLINAVRENGGSLLMTARRFPAAWRVHLPDLVSRLKAATLVELGEPDDALLGGVLTKLFADRQVDVDPAVVQFLVRRMERSLATASIIVEKLDRAALERKVPISRGLAAEMLTAMDVGQASLDFGG
jgi:chromosomal replication initiation ATPase DnaA